MRALADQFADAVAPDLSNRVRDGRWVTILAWCLVRSHEVFHAGGGSSVTTRSQQQARYAWLRPLELMWVARTIDLAEGHGRARSLAGQNCVRPWCERKDDGHRPDRFGMLADQFRAYRQTGMYGGYRVAFRKWRDMTQQGDGWTPDLGSRKLANWLDGKLGVARPRWPLHESGDDEDSLWARSVKLGKDDECRECRWWLRQWHEFRQEGRNTDRNTLPRRNDDFDKLPEAELLKPLLFEGVGNGQKRLKVARAVARSGARDHSQVCIHLGRVFKTDDPIVALLPGFSRLADAGMAAMDLVAKSLQNQTSVSLSTIAAETKAKRICRELMEAAQEWLQRPAHNNRHIEAADKFARRIPSARPGECLRALLQHHEEYGGGLRWFVLRNDRVEIRTPPRVGSSRYRFRLWSLCRLATQCGVLRTMPRALREKFEAAEGENDE